VALTPDDIVRVPVESVTEGDFIVPEIQGSAWRVGKVEREGNERLGFAVALYAFPDDPDPVVREREGTFVKCIRRPL
jgi:hypothetical protein